MGLLLSLSPVVLQAPSQAWRAAQVFIRAQGKTVPDGRRAEGGHNHHPQGMPWLARGPPLCQEDLEQLLCSEKHQISTISGFNTGLLE